MLKAIYETPVLRIHGKVEVLTKASGCPANLDNDFPTGTAFHLLTCS